MRACVEEREKEEIGGILSILIPHHCVPSVRSGHDRARSCTPHTAKHTLDAFGPEHENGRGGG